MTKYFLHVIQSFWNESTLTVLLTGVSRRQVKNFTKIVNKFKILEFGDYIRNLYEKSIQLSTNMPSIG